MFSEILNVITKSMGNMDVWSNIGSVVTWGTIAILFFVHYFWYYKPFKKSLDEKDFTNTEAISAASNFGVLGTFIGITFGLATFDSTNISASVPMLLEGMKTAFFTSIIGMVGAQLLRKKLRNAIEKNAEVINTDDKDYSELLVEGNNVQKKVLEGIGALTNAIGGDGDSTLLSQMKALRLENRDELQGLRKEFTSKFEDFAKTMAENNSKAFIEALNATIRDFNNKIQEQFGENFKQLNIAVGKLLEWQENYKATLESICEQYKAVGQSIDGSKVAMEAIAEHSSSIEKSANSLTDIIVTAEKYEEELKKTLDNIVEISNQAKEAVPSIENLFNSTTEKSNQLFAEHIDNIVKGQNECIRNMTTANETLNDVIAGTVDKALAKNNEIMDKYADVQENIVKACQNSLAVVDRKLSEELEQMDSITKNLINNLDQRSRDLDNSNAKAVEAIAAAADRLSNSSLDVTKRVGDIIVKITNDSNETLKTQQTNMLKNLADTSNDLIKGFAMELAKISKQFSNDYIPLATRLREVIRLAENVTRNN